jgi:N-acyl-D-aspartate/D-glutamate deacylase
MTHDLVIRGGVIIDGTGAPGYEADLAIEGDRIVAIGRALGHGRREIDARGHAVSPGFVDLHTHLDAQIGWDPECTPVCWHGVTTALIGNCGVTFAPCKPSDREFLAGMMEAVEDIPRHAILTGLPWTWEDYGGYLDAIERLRPGVNVAGLVGHCAVRTFVMGERAVDEQPDDAERDSMARVVGEALERGAFGFSTNRYEPHKLPDGRCIPGTFADVDELMRISREVGRRQGLMQVVGGAGDILQSLTETGSRVLFSYGVGPEAGMGEAAARRLEDLCGDRDMTAIIQVRGSGYLFGLQSGLPFAGEAWDRLRKLDLAGRLEAISDPQMAERLEREGRIMDFLDPKWVFYLGDGDAPDYAAPVSAHLKAMAEQTGESFIGLFLRLSRESAGRGLFNLRMFCQNLDELGDLLKSRKIFPSLGDAGAHVSQIMDAGWSSFVLSHWVRRQGLYSLEEGLRRITSGPARVLGLRDRGTLAVGMKADINVFDPETVSELAPELVRDFPGGAPRYIQRAKGYRATIVNGVVSFEDGERVVDRAGRLLRRAA